MKPAKPTRVHEREIEVFRCPVCRELAKGTLTVEIHVGETTIEVLPDGTPNANVDVATRMRSLDVSHRCTSTPDAVAADEPDLDTH